MMWKEAPCLFSWDVWDEQFGELILSPLSGGPPAEADHSATDFEHWNENTFQNFKAVHRAANSLYRIRLVELTIQFKFNG
jgi:hypothetical protein